MIIFTVLGILVSILITGMLILMAEEWLHRKSERYRIFVDWFELPGALRNIKRSDTNQINTYISFLEKIDDGRRKRIVTRAINKRIQILKAGNKNKS